MGLSLQLTTFHIEPQADVYFQLVFLHYKLFLKLSHLKLLQVETSRVMFSSSLQPSVLFNEEIKGNLRSTNIYWAFRKYHSFIWLLLFLLKMVIEYFLESSMNSRNGFGEL